MLASSQPNEPASLSTVPDIGGAEVGPNDPGPGHGTPTVGVPLSGCGSSAQNRVEIRGPGPIAGPTGRRPIRLTAVRGVGWVDIVTSQCDDRRTGGGESHVRATRQPL